VLDLHPNAVLKKEAFALRSRALLGAPPSDAADLAETSHEAALSFIANPALFVCDIFASAPVQALKGHKEYGAAYELLDVMLRGDLDAWEAGAFGGVGAAAGATDDVVLDKARAVVTKRF
jgi:hypothetical protein